MSRMKLDDLEELQELYGDLHEAQKKDGFLFDLGNLENVQWQPEREWGLKRKPKSLGDLVKVYEQEAEPLNTRLLKKDYSENPNFKRELSFMRLCEKYKNLDEEAKKEQSLQEFIRLQSSGVRRNSNSSIQSTPAYTGSYIDIMEKAKPRPLYGANIPDAPFDDFEVYVSSKMKAAKQKDQQQPLHVRSASAPHDDEAESEPKNTSLHHSDSYKSSKFKSPERKKREFNESQQKSSDNKEIKEKKSESKDNLPFKTYQSRVSPSYSYEMPRAKAKAYESVPSKHLPFSDDHDKSDSSISPRDFPDQNHTGVSPQISPRAVDNSFTAVSQQRDSIPLNTSGNYKESKWNNSSGNSLESKWNNSSSHRASQQPYLSQRPVEEAIVPKTVSQTLPSPPDAGPPSRHEGHAPSSGKAAGILKRAPEINDRTNHWKQESKKETLDRHDPSDGRDAQKSNEAPPKFVIASYTSRQPNYATPTPERDLSAKRSPSGTSSDQSTSSPKSFVISSSPDRSLSPAKPASDSRNALPSILQPKIDEQFDANEKAKLDVAVRKQFWEDLEKQRQIEKDESPNYPETREKKMSESMTWPRLAQDDSKPQMSDLSKRGNGNKSDDSKLHEIGGDSKAVAQTSPNAQWRKPAEGRKSKLPDQRNINAPVGNLPASVVASRPNPEGSSSPRSQTVSPYVVPKKDAFAPKYQRYDPNPAKPPRGNIMAERAPSPKLGTPARVNTSPNRTSPISRPHYVIQNAIERSHDTYYRTLQRGKPVKDQYPPRPFASTFQPVVPPIVITNAEPLMSSTPNNLSPRASTDDVNQTQNSIASSFSVKDFRKLAENNEFAQGKFASYRNPSFDGTPYSNEDASKRDGKQEQTMRGPQQGVLNTHADGQVPHPRFQHRAASTSDVNADDGLKNPNYGRLKNWSGVMSGLNENDADDEYGKLKKWNAADLQQSVTSSSDTLVINGSSQDLGNEKPPSVRQMKNVFETNRDPGMKKYQSDPDILSNTEYKPDRLRSKSERQLNNYKNDDKSKPLGAIKARFEEVTPKYATTRTISGDLHQMRQKYGADDEFDNSRMQMPRTVSGDLADIRHAYGDDGTFHRGQVQSYKSAPDLGKLSPGHSNSYKNGRRDQDYDKVWPDHVPINGADLKQPYKSATTQVITKQYHTAGVPKARRPIYNRENNAVSPPRDQKPHYVNPTNKSRPAEASQKHHHSTSDLPSHKSPVGTLERHHSSTLDRRRRDEEEARRKEYLRQITEEEKRKRAEEEYARNEARKHSDFFSAKQKSPIPIDRFGEDLENMAPMHVPKFDKKHRPTEIKGKAKALYSFKSQSHKELSFRKGDIIYLTRQIDKNWYEGEHHGHRGIFPVNYVEITKTLEEARAIAQSQEGAAKVKYTFKKQSPVELSAKKGAIATLIRRVDENWYEAKVDGIQGIIPISYLDILREPDTPFTTPAPSVVQSAAPSAFNTPGPGTPVRPMSPLYPNQLMSPSQNRENYFDFQDYSPRQERRQQYDSSSKDGDYDQSLDSFIDTLSKRDSSSHRQDHSPTKRDGYRDISQDYNPRLDAASAMVENYKLQQKEKESRPAYDRTLSLDRRSMGRDGYYRDKETPPPPPQPKHEQPLKPYRAVFAYAPQNQDELDLREGDSVYVLERCDDGWFVGTNARTGQFGTFPGNYVQPV